MLPLRYQFDLQPHEPDRAAGTLTRNLGSSAKSHALPDVIADFAQPRIAHHVTHALGLRQALPGDTPGERLMLVYGVRASVGRVTANASSVPSFDPLREAGARTDNVLVTPACSIATFHRAAPARCGAFADERRIVGGDDGGRVRRRDAHPFPRSGWLRRKMTVLLLSVLSTPSTLAKLLGIIGDRGSVLDSWHGHETRKH
jgi:hypothetical protein